MSLHLRSARLLPHRLSKLLPTPKPLHLFPSTRNLGFRSLRFRSAAAMASPSPLPVKETIDLTETEAKIFGRLLDVVRHFKLDTQLRVAGGWVRDKLLGKDCYDIDIALDNMFGREFCDKVNEYLLYVGEEEQKACVIKCNPAQSKHLETARMHIYGTWIDFVNLRSETYAENSRIPTMKFGSAKEDAYRRDLTINSLFFNINTSSVEDLTGKGVHDLKAGNIITPLPPKATFLDDPLRVLRAIRFGARFNFVLDEELKKAASDMEVRAAIADKISRERIGHEIDLMVSGNHPVKAMSYVCDLQLFSAVFAMPENSQPPVTEECDRLCISYIDAAWKVLELIGYSEFSMPRTRGEYRGKTIVVHEDNTGEHTNATASARREKDRQRQEATSSPNDFEYGQRGDAEMEVIEEEIAGEQGDRDAEKNMCWATQKSKEGKEVNVMLCEYIGG